MNRCIISKESDPYYNLALEEELLRNVDDDEIILYLWQNYRTVGIGRNQNPFLECDIDRMNAEGVMLARRICHELLYYPLRLPAGTPAAGCR